MQISSFWFIWQPYLPQAPVTIMSGILFVMLTTHNNWKITVFSIFNLQQNRVANENWIIMANEKPGLVKKKTCKMLNLLMGNNTPKYNKEAFAQTSPKACSHPNMVLTLMSKHRTHTDGVEEQRLPWTFGGQCRWYVVYCSKCCEQWKSKGEERDVCDVFRYVLTRKVIGRETGEGKQSSVASDVGSGMPEDTFEPCEDAMSLIQ